MAEIIEIVIYLIGSFCSIFWLYFVCRKEFWQTSGNIKYLTTVQIVLSFLALSSNFVLVSLEYFPKYLCVLVPAVMLLSLSMAIFNLMFLAIVKHAQITNKWKLRYSSTILILVTVFFLSVASVLLVLYGAVVGRPIIKFGGCLDPNTTTVKVDGTVDFDVKDHVSSYSSLYFLFQFFIPCNIIINRVILIAIFVSEKKEVEIVQTKLHVLSMADVREATTNIMTTAVVVLVIFLAYRNYNNSTWLSSFNFHARLIFNIAFFLSSSLFVHDIVSTYKKSNADNSCTSSSEDAPLLEKITLNTD